MFSEAPPKPSLEAAAIPEPAGQEPQGGRTPSEAQGGASAFSQTCIACRHVYLRTPNPPVYLSIDLSACLSVSLSIIYLSVYLSIQLSTDLSIYLSMHLFTYPSIDIRLLVYVSTKLAICVLISLSLSL